MSSSSPNLSTEELNTIRLMIGIEKVCNALSTLVPVVFGEFLRQVTTAADRAIFIRNHHRYPNAQAPLPTPTISTVFRRFAPEKFHVASSYAEWDATIFFNVIENLMWLDNTEADLRRSTRVTVPSWRN